MPFMVDATIRIEVDIDGDSGGPIKYVDMPGPQRREVQQHFMGVVRELVRCAPLTYWSWSALRMQVDDTYSLERAQVEEKVKRQLRRLNREMDRTGPGADLSIGTRVDEDPKPKLPKCAGEDKWTWKVNIAHGRGTEEPWVSETRSGVKGTFLLTISWEVPKPGTWDREDPADWS